MSRREDRSSDAGRHRSRFDREPSPKKSRRDVKVESGRPPAETKSDRDRDLDQRHHFHRRLRDPLPLETPLAVSKDTDKKINGSQGGTKRSSDQTKVPQSRSYFQHDERAIVGQNGKGSSRKTNRDGGWWRDSKEHQRSRSEAKDEKAKDSRGENHIWRHDGFFQMEANQGRPARKRPAFREQKEPADPKQTEKTAGNPTAAKVQDNVVESGKRDMNRFTSSRSDRPGRSSARERESSKAEIWSNNTRDKYGGNRYRGGRVRINGRQQGYHIPGEPIRVEKWKHDLYDEANKSPATKNEEDQISKIEALLAS